MSGDWRYIATRQNGNGTETFLDYNLPLSGVKFTPRLSGTGSLEATIEPEIASQVGVDGKPIIQPWSTTIYPEASGTIRGGFIVDSVVVSGSSLKISAVSFTGYLQGMPCTRSVWSNHYPDCADVIREIWRHAQAQVDGNLGLVVNTTFMSKTTLGVPAVGDQSAQPYQFAWFTVSDLGAEIDRVVDAGKFDYRERHYWSGDTIKHALDLGRPIGRQRSDLRFVSGENIFAIPDLAIGGDDFATDIMYLGAGDGSKKVRGTASQRGTGRLRRVVSISDPGVSSATYANSLAKRELDWRLGLEHVDEVVVANHPNAQLGSWIEGDEIELRMTTGWAGKTDIWCRVTATTYSPEDLDSVTLSVTPVM